MVYEYTQIRQSELEKLLQEQGEAICKGEGAEHEKSSIIDKQPREIIDNK